MEIKHIISYYQNAGVAHRHLHHHKPPAAQATLIMIYTLFRSAMLLGAFALTAYMPSFYVTDVTGNWQLDVVLESGSGTATFEIEQYGNELGGFYTGSFGLAEIQGTIEGDQLNFSFEVQGIDVSYTGEVDGKTMSGRCQYGSDSAGTFKGKKAS